MNSSLTHHLNEQYNPRRIVKCYKTTLKSNRNLLLSLALIVFTPTLIAGNVNISEDGDDQGNSFGTNVENSAIIGGTPTSTNNNVLNRTTGTLVIGQGNKINNGQNGAPTTGTTVLRGGLIGGSSIEYDVTGSSSTTSDVIFGTGHDIVSRASGLNFMNGSANVVTTDLFQQNTVNGSGHVIGTTGNEFVAFNILQGEDLQIVGDLRYSNVIGEFTQVTGSHIDSLNTFEGLTDSTITGSRITSRGAAVTVNGESIVAMGDRVTAIGNNIIALGDDANVQANNAVALGGGTVTADGGVAIGALSVSDMTVAQTMAAVNGPQTITTSAAGNGTVTTGTAYNITINETHDAGGGEVSFGDSNGNNRLLTGIADGAITADSDQAITGSQVYQIIQQIRDTQGAGGGGGGGDCTLADGTDCGAQITENITNITENTENITELDNRVTTNEQNIATNTRNIATNTRNIAINAAAISENRALIDANTAAIAANTAAIQDVQTEARRGIAGVAALAAAENPNLLVGESGVAGGFGNFKDTSAYAFTAAYRPSRAIQINAGIASSNDDTVQQLGISFKFGRFTRSTNP